MSSPALQTEDIAWSVRSLLENDFASFLLEVESERNAEGRRVVMLPNPQVVEFGFSADALEASVEHFPRVSFLAGPRSPEPIESDYQLYASATHEVLIGWMVLGANPEEATIRAWRYGEAIAKAIRESGPFAGFEPATLVPQTDEMLPLQYEGETPTYDGMIYVAGGQMSIPMKGVYS